MVIDITIILFFVLAIVGMVMGYKQYDNTHKVFGDGTSSTEVISEAMERSLHGSGSGRSRFTSSAQPQFGGADSASSTTTTSDELFFSGSLSATSGTSVNDLSSGGVSEDERVRFKDVTTKAYKNLRLGFVMEIPVNWHLYYEYSDEVLFVSDAVTQGTSVDDVRHTQKAMWLSVGVSCQSGAATSTSFALLNASTTPTRERYACVPPLKINMGLRGDQPNLLDHQAFLLDIARTVYPIVKDPATGRGH